MTSRSASADGVGVGAEHSEEELDDDGFGRGLDVGSIPSLIDSVNDQLARTNTSQPPISQPFVRLLITPPARVATASDQSASRTTAPCFPRFRSEVGGP